MSWLDKFIRVEDEKPAVEEVVASVVESQAPVQVDIVMTDNIVDEIFSQNDMSAKDNSIYIVQKLIETLPPEMTTSKKQGTVAGILTVSGKSVENLVADAKLRVETLRAACNKVVAECSTENDIANADIEDLKKAIEAATIKIKENEELMDATKKAVGDEISRIDSLVEFCNGMEAK